jgi:large subunit ribosomal protein L18
MDKNKQKRIKLQLRHNRVRSTVTGSVNRPRLSVFRANRHIHAQLIDDTSEKTLVAASSLEVKDKGKKTDLAGKVGSLIAKKALEKGVKEVVFDRGGYRYHGRVKALAEAAREAGLKF